MILEPFDEMKYQPESMTEKNYHDTEVIIRNLREILPFDYEINNPFDDDIFEDIKGTWEYGGNWEKFDPTGTSLISFIKWKIHLNRKTEARERKNFCVLKREKLLQLLSLKSELGHILEKVNNSKVYALCKQKVSKHHSEEQAHNKIAIEFMESLDHFTFWVFNKMINHHLLRNVDGILNINGKYSLILHAQLYPNYSKISNKLTNAIALKVFKKVVVFYDNREKIAYFPTWILPTIAHSTTKTLNLKAEKEFCNLQKLTELGIRCPQPIRTLKNLRHIVVMSFIGKDMKSAPKFKDITLKYGHNIQAYHEIKEAMRIMYQQANLIHNDLLNHILWHKKHCYFIDYSHAIDTEHENALKVLKQNCNAITNHFSKITTKKVLSVSKLMHYIQEGSLHQS